MDDRVVLATSSILIGWFARGLTIQEDKEPQCHCGCHCGCHCEGGILVPLIILFIAGLGIGLAVWWQVKKPAEKTDDSPSWSKGKKGVFGQGGKVLTLTH